MEAQRRPARRRTALLALALLAYAVGAPRAAGAALPTCDALLAQYKADGYKNCAVMREGRAALLWKGKGDVVTLRPVYAVDKQDELGWLGFGFSDFGSMKGGDLYVVHKDSAGSGWTVSDCHATANQKPELDASQDAKLLSMAFDAATSTWSAEITRRMKTCDLTNDFEVEAGRGNYVIWSFGPASKATGFDSVLQHYDYARGNFAVDLFPVIKAEALGGVGRRRLSSSGAVPGRAVLPEAQIQETARSVVGAFQMGQSAGPKCVTSGTCDPLPTPGSARAARVTPDAVGPITDNPDGTKTIKPLCSSPIPTAETTYMTCYFELPSDQTYHVLKYKGIYGHRLVHHSLGYACTKEVAEPKVEELLRTTGPGPYNQKSHAQVCEVFYFVPPSPYGALEWYEFPKKAALPIGKDSYKYIAIEVHYNNPLGATNEVDPGTGLEIVFAPKAKKKDVGVLTISQFLLNIEANQQGFKAGESVCHTNCTKRFKSNVVMFAQNVHMHGLGASVTTRRTRKGKAMEPLAYVRGFDYNFQTWIDMPDKQRILKKGDELSMTCVFDSRGRTNTTRWGYATSDEMCFWWIYYYPAQPEINICSTLDISSTYGGADLNLCMADATKLIQLKSAADANDVNAAAKIIAGLTQSGEGFLGTPQKITKTFDDAKGCSAQVP